MDTPYHNEDNYYNNDPYYNNEKNQTQYQEMPSVPQYLLMMLICFSFSASLYRLCNHITTKCINEIQKYRYLQTRIITSDDEENLLNECSICLEQYIKKDKIIELSCNHMFHKKCIKEWIKNNNTCPQCRENII